MKISVIIPIYNQEQFLRPLMDCILSSQEQDIEILAINDGSTDTSLDILQQYSDQRLKVYSKPNEGLYKTWKYGVSKAQGDYLMFIDSDDEINPQVFTDMKAIIQHYQPSLIQFGFYITKNSKKQIFDFALPDGFYQGDELTQLRKDLKLCPQLHAVYFPVTRWSKVFKANEFKKFLQFSVEDANFCEDTTVTVPYAHLAKSLYVTHQVYYNWKIRKNSMSQSRFKESDYLDYLNLARYFTENKKRFNLSDQELFLIKQKNIVNIFNRLIEQKNYAWCRKILQEFDNRELILKGIRRFSKFKRFLINHNAFRSYRLLKKIKRIIRH